MGYAFISYSTKNQSSADAMHTLLAKHGIKTWMAPYDIPVGSKYAMVINRAVKECSCFILLLTNDSQNSVWVAKEVERAINYRKPLIPLQLEDVVLNDEFELYISSDQITAVSKIDDTTEEMQKILSTIKVITQNGEADNSAKPAKPVKKGKSTSLEKKKTAKAKKASDEDDLDTPFTQEPVIDATDNSDVKAVGNKILKTLAEFGIKAKIIGADKGAQITRYLVVPAPGVKVSSIERLADNIALALNAVSLRIEAHVPGKSAIGIEVPNGKRELVLFRDIVNSQEFLSLPSPTAFVLGKDVEDKIITSDISKMPHLIVAGATGMGKGVCVNTIMGSIISKAGPEDVRFILIDPKRVEFSLFNGLPHLLTPILYDMNYIVGALKYLYNEMERRIQLLFSHSTRSIDAYNALFSKENADDAKLYKIVVFIDELNDLMIQAKEPIETLIMAIAQKGRVAGIHLVIGTQRPSVNVLTGVVKANIPSRICFKTVSAADSRTVLEQSGAEKLLDRGDMYFSPAATGYIQRLQCAFISDNELSELVGCIKEKYGEAVYDKAALDELHLLANDIPSTSEDTAEEEMSDTDRLLKDPKFLKAVELTIENGEISTSLLQRRLHLGYGKAAMFIDAMADFGVVEDTGRPGPKVAVLTMEQWKRVLRALTEED